jgi:NAD(P)-dependent dehydrogenase (short-subunit alcohol dehydrogenase family)
MKDQFKNQTIIVTGASFGIGRATAIAFAENGANVVVADCVQDDETVNAIKEKGGNAIFVNCDVSKEEDVKRMVDLTIATYGGLDYAFNNAGIEGLQGSTHECTTENWERTIGVNLTGTWLCMKHQIPHILAKGKGAIVNCASIAGLVGYMGLPAYVASKHGVVGLTKTAALEYAKQGIRINAVCPGVIKTPMIDRFTGLDKAVEKQFADMEPIGRMGEPQEVADAVMWLCSDSSSFVTGHAMAVDGGWIAQ